MHIDSREIARVAAATEPRCNMYAGIHKALRAAMADTLVAVGRVDALDEQELERTGERVRDLLEFCRVHLRHENEFLHPAIESRAPGATAAVAHDHDEHLRHIELLASAVATLPASAPEARRAAAGSLYGELALFIAENFHHMHVEETAHNAVLWARYTDAELVAMHEAMLASVPPEEMMPALRWLVPAMDPQERAMLLGDVRAKAPAQAFEAILQMVRPHLEPQEWTKLARALATA